MLFADDLVIATVASHPTQPNCVVGKHVIVPEDMEGALLNQKAVRISPNNNDVLGKRVLSLLGRSSIYLWYAGISGNEAYILSI